MATDPRLHEWPNFAIFPNFKSPENEADGVRRKLNK